jgi:apolipoprotein N-acyltransferase
MRELGGGAGCAVLRRVTKVAAAVCGGLLLSASFPPLSWWFSAVLGVALLAFGFG